MTGVEAGSDRHGVAAVDRALSILAAIEAAPIPRTLAEVAAATGLYKSTILRLMGSVEAAGLIARLPDGRYGLGPAACRLGISYERANPVASHAMPVLQALVAAGSESASFHVRLDAVSRLCVLRVDSAHSTLDRVSAGDVLPLDRGAPGGVLSAGADAPAFVVSLGERDSGCAAMAAPVFGADGSLRGALSLSGARERFTESMIEAWQPKLIDAAGRITRALRGRV